MLKSDQIERLKALGADQLAIAEKWEQEKEERGKLIEKIGKAEKAGDHELLRDLMEIFCDAPDRCEHDRSIWTPCAGCEEIEQALHPEFYDENGDRLEDEEVEAIINAHPERYSS